MALSQHTLDQAAAHAASVGTLIAAFFRLLPEFVAVIPAIYYAILIWESKTVQRRLRLWRMKRRARALIRLKAQVIRDTAKVVAVHVEATAAVVAEAVVAQATVDKATSEQAAVDVNKAAV